MCRLIKYAMRVTADLIRKFEWHLASPKTAPGKRRQKRRKELEALDVLGCTCIGRPTLINRNSRPSYLCLELSSCSLPGQESNAPRSHLTPVGFSLHDPLKNKKALLRGLCPRQLIFECDGRHTRERFALSIEALLSGKATGGALKGRQGVNRVGKGVRQRWPLSGATFRTM